MKRNLRSLLPIVLLALFAAISIPGFSQSVRGVITGLVSDPSGAVIPGATVTLTNPATSVTSVTTSNGAGVYRFDGVLVGEYDIKVVAKGFQASTAHAIVTVGAQVGRDFTMKIGDSTTVTVNDVPPDLQTEEAVHSTVVASEALATMPISGQNSLNLLLTAPGVANSKTNASADAGIGAVNGARARSNNFLLDGINNNDISVMGPQFSATNNDALQEVSIQTTNFSAQYGRAGGAVIIQVTKSGTNQLHGTAAEVYKSHVFYASTQTQRNTHTADPTLPLIPKFVENIPAFTIGGPVVIPHLYNGKNKTFFFAAAQWDRWSSGGSTGSFVVPTEVGYQTLSALKSACPNVAAYLAQVGSARGSATATDKTTIGIDVQANLASTTCNGTARTGQQVEVSSFTRSVAELITDNNHMFRIDHVISPKQNIMVRWMWDQNQDNLGGTLGITSDFDVPFKGNYLTANINHNYAITNNVANEFRFGFSRNNYGWFIGNGIASTTPAISVGGISTLALSTSFPQGRISNTWQFEDDVTVTKGRHSFKVGAQVLRQLAVQQAPYNLRGSVSYASTTTSAGLITAPINSLANYIDNFGGAGGSAAISFGTPRYHPNLLTLSFFGQDTWKISKDLTVNIGIRYENFGQPANIFKYPAFKDVNTPIDDTSKVTTNKYNFGPNIGFSWAPGFLSKSHDLVVRAGYSISYDTFYNNMLSNMAAAGPNTQTSQPIVSTTNSTTPRGYVGLAAVLPALVPVALNPYTSASSQFKKLMRNPYYNHISFGVQKTMPGGVLLEVSYVGSLGRQLFFTNSVNPAMPNATFSGTATQSTPYGTQTLRLYPNRGAIQNRESGVTSNFNSLQVVVRRRALNTMVGTFFLNANYTWSKNMDIITEIFNSYGSGQNPSKSLTQYGSLKKWDYAPADTDRRHISTTMIQWNVKGIKSNRAAEIATAGWTLVPVLYASSGQPYTIFNGTDRDLDGTALGDRPNVGSMSAPVNTRAVITSTANCTSGYYDPNLRTTSAVPISGACVDPTKVRWVQGATYDPVNPLIAHRNSVYAGRNVRLDFEVLKTIRIVERVNFELRGEFFDLANMQNFDTGTQTAGANSSNAVSSTANVFQNFALYNGGSRSFRVGGKIIF